MELRVHGACLACYLLLIFRVWTTSSSALNPLWVCTQESFLLGLETRWGAGIQSRSACATQKPYLLAPTSIFLLVLNYKVGFVVIVKLTY